MFNFSDNVDGDKFATKSKVDNFVYRVDFRLCCLCVSAVSLGPVRIDGRVMRGSHSKQNFIRLCCSLLLAVD